MKQGTIALLALAAALGALPEPKPARMPDAPDLVAELRAKADAKRAKRQARNLRLTTYPTERK